MDNSPSVSIGVLSRDTAMAIRIASLCFAVHVLFTSQVAMGALLYDNGVGGASDIETGFFSVTGGVRAADEFSFPFQGTISSVSWTGVYSPSNAPPATDDFTIDIFAPGVTPGALLASFPVGNAVNRTDSGVDLSSGISSFDVYDYSATIDFTFSQDTLYWISIANDIFPASLDPWGWGSKEMVTELIGRSVDGGLTWTLAFGQPDFRLEGTAVPEPGSLPYVSLIVAAMIVSRYLRLAKNRGLN